MAEEVGEADPELRAIQAVVRALSALENAERLRVLQYAVDRFSIELRVDGQKVVVPPHLAAAGDAPASAEGDGTGESDIHDFTRLKAPNSGIEMVTVLAHFLANEVRPDERKTEISSEDITAYFPQADFPLPAKPGQCLVDAKNKGWLQPGSSPGTYKLSPVGQNLVRHKLPRATT
jgi:hypothetical protein